MKRLFAIAVLLPSLLGLAASAQAAAEVRDHRPKCYSGYHCKPGTSRTGGSPQGGVTVTPTNPTGYGQDGSSGKVLPPPSGSSGSGWNGKVNDHR
jgi:hypothetical protein